MIKHITKRMIKRIVKRMTKHMIMHIIITIKNERITVIFKLFRCMLIALQHIIHKLNPYDLNKFKNPEIDHLI